MRLLSILSKLKGTIIFFLCLLISFIIVKSKPEIPIPEEKPKPPTVVRFLSVKNVVASIKVSTQGTVQPKRRTTLTSKVGGTILQASDEFVTGGQFKKGELLLKMEELDYKNAVVQARLNLSQAKEQLAIEIANANQAKTQWTDLGDSEANALFLRKPQLERARISVEAAKQNLKSAKVNLKRTSVQAPFDGRIIDVNVNIGQVVSSLSVLATIYDTAQLLVVAPLNNQQIQVLKLLSHTPPKLVADIILNKNNREYIVPAQLSHTSSTINNNSRLINTIIETNSPELLPGMFVDVNIYSDYTIPQFEIPKKALHLKDQVYTLSAGKLQLQKITILNNLLETVVISGLEDGVQLVIERPLWSRPGDSVEAQAY